MYGDMAEEEVNKIMALADVDGSGEIDYSEWLMATMNMKNLVQDQKLKTAFEFFDKDGSGDISLDELKEVLGGKSVIAENKVWEDLIKDADTNGDGLLSFEEFKVMMNKLVQSEQITALGTQP